jgi:zeaxanthin glucosyltransferase
MATLARRLRARGHEVLFAGLEDDQPWAQREGIPYRTVLQSLFPAGFGDELKSRWRSPLHHARFALEVRSRVAQAIAQLPEIARGLSDFGADLVICDALHPMGWFLGALTGARMVVLHTTFPQLQFASPPVWTALPNPGDALSRARTRWAWRREIWLRWLSIGHWSLPSVGYIARHLGEERVAHARERGFLFSELPGVQMVACPAELDFPAVTERPSHYHYVESMVEVDRSDGAIDLPPLQRKPILASLGTAALSVGDDLRIARKLAMAFALLPEETFVFSVGRSVRREDLPSAPNVLLFDSVPQLALLGQARLMVTHGGLGSLKEALLFGVPVVVTPMTRDQPGNGARVTHHGLGATVDVRRASPESLAGTIRAVLADEAISGRVARMRDRFLAAEQRAPSVALLESLMPATPLEIHRASS